MNFKTRDLVKAGLFIGLGIILPYVFHMTGIAGPIFLPMHIPVLLCGFILGPRYGFLVGGVTPLLNSIFTGMPPIYPIGISMTFELAIYGLISGYMYKSKRLNLLLSLIIAMLLGRFVSGISNYLLLTFGGKSYVFKMFIASAFIKPIWGISIQIVSIPIIVKLIENYKGVIGTNE